jgi:hypothetical protein
MPRYFFHLRRSSTRVIDGVGAHFPSVEAARRQAELSTRVMPDQGSEGGELATAIEIADRNGHIVHTVPFPETMLPRPTKVPPPQPE